MQTLKDDVRERIVDSAKAEFLEKGIDKASMRDIAAGSNMTVGNLYRYFRNKEELNSFIVGETLSEINRLVMEKSSNTVSINDRDMDINLTVSQYADVLDDLADELVDIYKKHKVEFNILMMHSKLNDSITDWFADLIKHIIKSNYGLDEYDRQIGVLSHGYAVSVFAGIKDIFRHADVETDSLKNMIKIFFRSYINNLSADFSLALGEK
ncbi:MAG: TetR/AcrR family transcriptional regulator [Firmicutes bacterium]|nr:TetR/AcrR family transcriptional regulator [Bacillota bacterium]